MIKNSVSNYERKMTKIEWDYFDLFLIEMENQMKKEKLFNSSLSNLHLKPNDILNIGRKFIVSSRINRRNRDKTFSLMMENLKNSIEENWQ